MGKERQVAIGRKPKDTWQIAMEVTLPPGPRTDLLWWRDFLDVQFFEQPRSAVTLFTDASSLATCAYFIISQLMYHSKEDYLAQHQRRPQAPPHTPPWQPLTPDYLLSRKWLD